MTFNQPLTHTAVHATLLTFIGPAHLIHFCCTTRSKANLLISVYIVLTQAPIPSLPLSHSPSLSLSLSLSLSISLSLTHTHTHTHTHTQTPTHTHTHMYRLASNHACLQTLSPSLSQTTSAASTKTAAHSKANHKTRSQANLLKAATPLDSDHAGFFVFRYMQYTRPHIHTHTHTHAHAHAHTHTHTYTHTHARARTRTHTHTRARAHMYTHVLHNTTMSSNTLPSGPCPPPQIKGFDTQVFGLSLSSVGTVLPSIR